MKQENVEYVGHLFAQIFAYLDLKVLFGAAWSIVVFLFGTGQNEALIALLILIAVDWVFGVAAAKISGETITSAKFFRTPLKIGVYFTLIAASHISEYSLPVVAGFLDETMTAALVLTELLSIFEKSGKMGFVIPQRFLNQLIELRDGPLATKK